MGGIADNEEQISDSLQTDVPGGNAGLATGQHRIGGLVVVGHGRQRGRFGKVPVWLPAYAHRRSLTLSWLVPATPTQIASPAPGGALFVFRGNINSASEFGMCSEFPVRRMANVRNS
ncbi:hypothetical protein ACYG9Z_18990 [Mesorhizobium sp. RSR380A]|uniref:hypothetical protein n=1 Tax=unclassified Mesorhizobium TaxID=325217 RepID=UPI0012EC65F2|nr:MULTISPECIES: hypothetical protein [unclassified Mesorhizobium]